MDDTTSITPTGEEATRQEQGRAQVGALVALAGSVKTGGQMKYATIEQLQAFMISVAPLVGEATRLLEVRAQQSASGRTSTSRRAVVA